MHGPLPRYTYMYIQHLSMCDTYFYKMPRIGQRKAFVWQGELVSFRCLVLYLLASGTHFEMNVVNCDNVPFLAPFVILL